MSESDAAWGWEIAKAVAAMRKAREHETVDETCPWCGVQIQDLWDYEIKRDRETEIDCPDCEKPIRVVMEQNPIYTMNRAGGDEGQEKP